MSKCIFCMSEFDKNELTTEHIFPEAIGGNLTIDSVCKNCNSFLGSNIDSLLVNFPTIQIKREEYSLSGKKGKIPYFFSGVFELVEENRKTRIANGQKLKLILLPKTEENTISFDASEINEMFPALNKKLKRNGYSQLTKEQYGELIKEGNFKNNEVKLEMEERKTLTKEIHKQIIVNLYDPEIAVMKIVYELSYLYLGKKYLYDETAIKFRNIFNEINDNKDIEKASLIYKYKIRSEVGLKPSNNFFEYLDENYHFAFFFVSETGICCTIRIFKSIYASIVISENPEEYELNPRNFFLININKKPFYQLPLVKVIGKNTSGIEF